MSEQIVQEIRLKWNYRILVICMILMFAGTILPTILPKYGIDLMASVIIGAIVSVAGNLVLIYATKSKLVTTEIIYKLG